jgi:hypothetical protein
LLAGATRLSVSGRVGAFVDFASVRTALAASANDDHLRASVA